MWVDEIVEETRKVREEYAAKFEYDIAAIVADVKEKEKQSKRPVVSLPPKPPSSVPLAKAS
jgi:glycerol-3-phosphate cytidylyltransferase-like family protein